MNKELEKKFDEIMLDYCDVDCTATHTANDHATIKNVVDERLKFFIIILCSLVL